MRLSTRAIVLSKESFGEADCYIQFLTRDWGVISTLAKSAKKSKRRYIGGLDLFCHSEIYIKGDPKEKPYLQELSVLNSFSGLREDLEKVLIAGKFLQWVKKLANITTPIPQVYSLLGQTLALLEKEQNPGRQELLNLVFKLKLLAYLGLKPRTDSCVKCSNEEILGGGIFDFSHGGILCRTCSPIRTLEDPGFISEQEKSLFDVAEDLKLTVWQDLRFPEERLLPLQRLLTQFASYHTQTRLPV